MATTSGNKVIRMTADNDTYGNASMGRLKFKGARLVAGAAAAATASIKVTDTSGAVLVGLAAVTGTADECSIPFTCDSGVVFVDMAGAGAEVFLYLE